MATPVSTTQTNDKQSAKPRPATLNPRGLVSPVTATGSLQRAVATPEAARSGEILALQRRYGNHAVQRLLTRPALQARPVLQAALSVGPAHDAYEQEADQVASQVMRMPTANDAAAKAGGTPDIQTKPLLSSITRLVQRTAEEEEEAVQASRAAPGAGFVARPAVEDQLRAQRGGGRPLPSDVQAYMEPRFGADFSGVRVHTDGQAADLNRQINAQAVTHGQDIYVGAGHYNPGSDAGKRLLAHELTHTIQQTGGVQRRAKAGLGLAPARIQRLVARTDFEKLAGGLGFWEGMGGGTYKKLLQAMGQYQKDKDRDTLYRVLLLAETWMADHKGQKLSNADKRREVFLPGLITEAKVELGEAVGKANKTPSQYMETKAEGLKQGKEGLEKVNKDKESLTKEDSGTGDKPNYIFQVMAAVDIPEYLEFAKKRTAITLSNRRNLFQKRKPNAQIKQEAATATVEASPKYSKATPEEKKKAIDTLVENSYAVGHTWIKFVIRSNNKDTDVKSFGFWPLAHFASPSGAVPGRVKHPDNSDNDHSHLLRKDYPVDHKQYLNGLARAYSVLQSPPNYTLIDYNCTKFALDVAGATGVSFPANAFMRVPVEATLGLTQTEAYNPNALYNAMEKEGTGVDPKKEVEKQKAQREQQLTQLESITLTPYTGVDGEPGDPFNAREYRLDQFALADDDMQPHEPGWLEITVNQRSGGVMPYTVKKAEYEKFLEALRKQT